MPLPETIPVKYTEEEADHVSMRPLVRQNFRAAELVDMIVRVAGKDAARVEQILRAGTLVFQSYRYWWQGFEAEPAALTEILAVYPDADPSRAFRAEGCTEVIFEMAMPGKRHPLSVRREEAGKKPFWRSRSFWDCLMELAEELELQYREYSYALGADVYSAGVTAEQAAQIGRDAGKFASRELRVRLAKVSQVSQLCYVCPRRA